MPGGTHRDGDGSPVDFAAAVSAWTLAALPVLEAVARQYNETITYKDLAEMVQEAAGIRTRVLMMHWIGQVLGGVSRESHRRGQPMLSALCVHSDGTVWDGYAVAVAENYGVAPADLEMHAAEERLSCYQHFGADLPPGGGTPTLTPRVAARRAWQAGQARPDPPTAPSCPTCHIALPVSGVCDYCR